MIKKILLIVLIMLFGLLTFNPFNSLALVGFANAMVIYRGDPKPHSWARWMVGRTKRQNKNNLISIVGQTGSGKTYAGLSICEIMAKMDGVPFTIDHIVFSLRELMKLINSGTLKASSKILFDEPQASIGAREFQSIANKVFNLLASTFRHRNLSLFFCTPYESMLDKNTRKLFHGRFETSGINRTKKTCRLKPRFVEYSDFREQPYRKQMIVQFKKGGVNRAEKLFHWDVPLPSKELIEQYEHKKLEFTTNLNKNIENSLKKFDESGKSYTADNQEERKPITEIQERTLKVLASIKTDNKLEAASKILGVSIASVSKNRQRAEKKGYKVGEYREDEIKDTQIA